MAYIPLRKAIQQLGLHPNTLRKYADEGKIKTIKNEAGQRLYDVQSYVNGATCASTVCYCRVSSTKQRDDLERQVAFMQSLYPEAEIIRDIGSGINFKRKGLQTLLDRLLQGDKLTLIVAPGIDKHEVLEELASIFKMSINDSVISCQDFQSLKELKF